MKRRVFVFGALLALLGGLAYATTYYYYEELSPTDVNGTGGVSVAFAATRILFVASDKTGTPGPNAVNINLKSTTAAPIDFALAPGERLSMEWDARTGADGWTGYGAKCATGETAKLRVYAQK